MKNREKTAIDKSKSRATINFSEEITMSTQRKPSAKNTVSKRREIAEIKIATTKKTIRVKTRAVGRPTDYREEYAEYAYKLCLLGFIDTQLAEFFGISIPTLYLWRKKHPQFSKSTRLGKIMADALVANSLYNRAVGMKTNETHISVHEGQTILTPYVKEHLPDVNAAKFWLKNRQKELWRENFGVTDGQGGAFSIVIHEELLPESA